MAVAAYFYHEKVCRTMRTAIVSYLLKTFLTNRGKNKDKDKKKKIGKMSLIFEFPISKLGYMEFFIKI